MSGLQIVEWYHVFKCLKTEKPGLLAELEGDRRSQTQDRFKGKAVLCIGLITRAFSTARRFRDKLL